MALTWTGVLAWRLERHFLAGPGARDAAEVVGRLLAVPGISGDAATAVGQRLAKPDRDALDAALAADGVVKIYAHRGATQYVTPAVAVDTMALRAAGRQWKLKSWRSHYGVEPAEWPALRDEVRAIVAGRTMTRGELSSALAPSPRFGHVAHAFVDSSDTFLKPFMWQGDLIFGPDRDGQATVRATVDVDGWPEPPDLDAAGHESVLAYLGAFGPAGVDRVHYWLGEGLSAGRKRLDRWIAELIASGAVGELEVEGEIALCATEHADAIIGFAPSDDVRLLTGYDPWILGTGTADAHVVAPEHRALATKGANVVLAGAAIAGTWKPVKGGMDVAWFGGARRDDAVAAAGARMFELLGRRGEVVITAA